MKNYPTTFEILDDYDNLVAKIETFDEGAATVTIEYCTNATQWKEIADEVHKSLLAMKLESDVSLVGIFNCTGN